MIQYVLKISIYQSGRFGYRGNSSWSDKRWLCKTAIVCFFFFLYANTFRQNGNTLEVSPQNNNIPTPKVRSVVSISFQRSKTGIPFTPKIISLRSDLMDDQGIKHIGVCEL